MFQHFLTRLLNLLPADFQENLRRWRYRWQIRSDRFLSEEPELDWLVEILAPGAVAVDVGANVGHYTKRMSDLVGKNGRVYAFEPVPETFALLASNVTFFQNRNVTLVNAGLSDRASVTGISIPGVGRSRNYYQAHISENAELRISTFRLDDLNISPSVSVVKIDAEGHEGHVLLGMKTLLEKNRPVLILESGAREAESLLAEMGYQREHIPGSPNLIYRVG